VNNKTTVMRTDFVPRTLIGWGSIEPAPVFVTRRVMWHEGACAERLGDARESIARGRAGVRFGNLALRGRWYLRSTGTALGNTFACYPRGDRGRAHEYRRGGAR
jgi:hypothetical protein